MFDIPIYFYKFGLPKFMWGFILSKHMGQINLEKLRMIHLNLDVKLTDEPPYVEIGPELFILSIQDLPQEGLRAAENARPQKT